MKPKILVAVAAGVGTWYFLSAGIRKAEANQQAAHSTVTAATNNESSASPPARNCIS